MAVDLTDRRFVNDPYPVLSELRAAGPVHETFFGIRLVLSHVAVDRLHRDPRAGRDPRTWSQWEQVRPYIADSVLERTAARFMLNLDGTDHVRLRDMVGRAFTPRTSAAMASTISAIAAELIDEAQQAAADTDSPVDLMSAFARPLPVRVILALLGLPETDLADLARWSDAAALTVEPTLRRRQAAEASEAVAELTGYLADVIAWRRSHPDNHTTGLLAAFLGAQTAGGLRDDDELIAMLVLMFIAGHETTTNLIGNGLLALASHPDQWALLRGDPDRYAAGAVEELLRYDPPVQTNPRIPREDIAVAGCVIPAGTLTFGMIGAANRDPDVYDDPDRLDITRTPNPHLAFGGGAHFCVGAGLARLEGRVAFTTMARRWPHLDVDMAGVRRRQLLNLRGLDTLPVHLSDARRRTGT